MYMYTCTTDSCVHVRATCRNLALRPALYVVDGRPLARTVMCGRARPGAHNVRSAIARPRATISGLSLDLFFATCRRVRRLNELHWYHWVSGATCRATLRDSMNTLLAESAGLQHLAL
jgi:hypothetical protein